MKTKHLIFTGISTLLFSGLFLTGCKKTETAAPQPAAPAANVTTANQTQKANDQNNVENEFNRAMDESTNALQNCSETRSVASVCNLTVDTTMATHGQITLIYNGNDCDNQTSRTGSIIINLPYNGTVTTWTTAGAVAQLTFVNYKVTRLSDNKSITYNGFHNITNVSGGGWIQLFLGNTIIHKIRANMQITFDDGTNRTWQAAKTRTFTNTQGLIKNTITGDTAVNGHLHVATWGTNRLGQPFTLDVPTPVNYNLVGSVCLYRPVGVVVDYTSVTTLTFTYGVDIFGNSTNMCPWGYKIEWIDSNNATQHIVLPY